MSAARADCKKPCLATATSTIVALFALLPGNLAHGQIVEVSYALAPRAQVEERLRQVTMNNVKRQAILRQLFEQAGCTGDALADQGFKKKRPANVICTLLGATDSTIVLGAHFDHSTEYGEGAVDDWSGASLLPSLFQSLQARPRRHTFVFVGFGSEEEGRRGSKFFVSQLSEEQLSKTKAMVNLECLGMGPTKVWASHADRTLLGKLAEVAKALNLSLAAVNIEKVGTDDSEPFAKRGIPTLSLHSVMRETLRLLHSTSDNLKAIKFDDYYSSYHLIAAYLAYIDTILP